jgi:probable phosphoglycerate mutase
VTRLIIWRHGETAWNVEHRVQGQTDVELSDAGRAQAAVAAEFLADLRPDAIVASDLRRATDTATALATLTGLDVTLDRRLRERCYGQWEGLTISEIEQRWPEPYARWRRGQPVTAADVEESDDLGKRVVPALEDAAERASGGTVVVACHGGSARRGAGDLLGWPESVTRTLSGLSNCHWTELSRTPLRGWVLLAHNVGALPGRQTKAAAEPRPDR